MGKVTCIVSQEKMLQFCFSGKYCVGKILWQYVSGRDSMGKILALCIRQMQCGKNIVVLCFRGR